MVGGSSAHAGASGHATTSAARMSRTRPVMSPSRLKERAQQRGAAALVEPAINLWPVMAGRLVEDARAMLDTAALRVVGAEIKASDPRQRDRRGAHRTRFEGHVEIATVELFLPERHRPLAQHQHLGMR